MKKYYEIDYNGTQDEIVLELVKSKIELMKKGISDNYIDRLYKQEVCNIRKDLGIKNAISLSLVTHKETQEQWVFIHIYDYELPNEDWNCWTEVKYDEDKKLRYIQMEEKADE